MNTGAKMRNTMLLVISLIFPDLLFAVPSMTSDSLVYCLNNPKYATAARYCVLDSAGNRMDDVSVIGMTGQTYKYAAVYHTGYAAGSGWRYKVNLAASNDLMNWTFIRMLVDNADMPKIAQVNNGAWVVLTHEQWVQQDIYGADTGKSQLGFKLFYDYTDLMNGTIRSTWTATPRYSFSGCDGTPSFYDIHMSNDGTYWCVNATIGFHYWNGSRDLNGYATIARLFHPDGGTTWQRSTATAYNNLFINAGVTGNVGQRDTAAITGGRFNIQEGNIGQPATDWDKWRMWLYTYGDSTLYPDGNGTVMELAPQTPNGSYSFGNPAVSFVKSPSGIGQSICVSYFLFTYPGYTQNEGGPLIYYFDLGSLFSTHLETYNVMPIWTSTTVGNVNVSVPVCGREVNNLYHSSNSSIVCKGTDNSATQSYVIFKVFDVNIPVSPTTKLSYWMYPNGTLGKYVEVEFITTDGIRLASTAAVDQYGIRMHPQYAKGTVGTWTQEICNIGQWLSGKTIDQIYIEYDHPAGTGAFLTWVDDILITDAAVLPGDLNNDASVDNKDFAILAADWLSTGWPCDGSMMADIDGDCRIDLDDLALLAADWLKK